MSARAVPQNPPDKVVVGAMLVGLGATFCTWVSLSGAPPDCSSGVCWGGSSNNFLNWVRSPQGILFYFAVFLIISLIGGLIFRAVWVSSD